MTRAYYNEFDPAAAEWLRELMRHDHIAPGDVDERSILDVSADDLVGYTQCHFFAGIGGWSYALRLAGWPDDRPVWTGSPPCQPFSVAGEDLGPDDPRHLSPKFSSLVGAARPAMLFGEQVASAAVFGKIAGKSKRGDARAPAWAWWDDLSDRLEAAHYAVGASDIPAAGVGAPHIRQRTFFGAYDLRSAAGGLGNSVGAGLEGYRGNGPDRDEPGRISAQPHGSAGAASAIDRLAEPDSRERSGIAEHGEHVTDRAQGGRVQRDSEPARDSCAGGLEHGTGVGRIERRTQPEGRGAVGGCGSERLADADGVRRRAAREQFDVEHVAVQHSLRGVGEGEAAERSRDKGQGRLASWASPLDGFWANADWLFCRDGKWRPVEPGSEPLAHGVSGRVGLLRGYGNAICPWAAKEFIQVFEEVTHV